MYSHLRFSVLLIHPSVYADTVTGKRLRSLSKTLEDQGFTVLSCADFAEGLMVASTHHGLASIVISAEGLNDDSHVLDNVSQLLAVTRARAPSLPVFALGEQETIEGVAATGLVALRGLRGVLYLFENTVDFLGKQVVRAARSYIKGLLPPFFQALVKHTTAAPYSWHTPGHGGGVAYRKSPVGQAFYQFFGENTLRSDLSVSVPELGSLLDHTGPLAAAEQHAAQVFSADHTFFVINGTSTANKIVWQAMVARGDWVLVDRNCHKSILHSSIMTGAVPIFLQPTRNDWGIIGPIPLSELSEASIAHKIETNPLTQGKRQPIKLVVLTNSTYDGLCYQAERLKQTLNGCTNVLHFDEAWFAHAAFHPFYENCYGMDTGTQGPLVFSTQSSHKMLAAFSQASMIHVLNSEQHQLHPERFNESFMMHTSTSPQYGILASLDVAAAMMEGPAGQSLVQETLDEAINFRRAIAYWREQWPEGDWWFSCWQPEDALVNPHDRASWVLTPNAAWHGFGELPDGYVALDPIKVTLLTPGLTETGQFEALGIPAVVVSQFLRERGVVIEKTGLYSFLVLFTMGITKGKWSTLLAELLEFKRLFDEDAPLSDVLPSLVEEHSERYQRLTLQGLCAELHQGYQQHNTPFAMRHSYTDLPEPVCTPSDAYDALVRGHVEAVPVEQLAGRVAAVMLVPYPPGIPLIMPGERFAGDESPMLTYARSIHAFNEQFPGFEIEVHGLRKSSQGSTVDCLARSIARISN